MGEWLKWRFGVGVIVLFTASLVFSVQELRYLMFGRGTDARLVEAREVEVRSRRGGSRTKLDVTYEFTDEKLAADPRWADQAKRRVTDRVGLDWPVPPGTTVRVQFIPGTESSRLEGNGNEAMLWVFGVFLAIGVGWGLWFWRFYRS